MKKSLRNVGLISLLILTLSCKVNLYPKLDENNEHLGLSLSPTNEVKLTSYEPNSFVKLDVPVLHGTKNVLFKTEFAELSKQEDLRFNLEDHIKANVELKNGTIKECKVIKAKNNSIEISKSDSLAFGLCNFYIKSPKRLNKITTLNLSITVNGVDHDFSFTPKYDLMTKDLSEIELPTPYGHKIEVEVDTDANYVEVTEPTKVILTPEQQKIQNSIVVVNNITNNIRTNISEELKQTMLEMRKNQSISNNLNTQVKADLLEEVNEDGKLEYNLKVEYEYALKDLANSKTLNYGNVADDFGPGKFKLSDSKAARVTVSMLKNTIENRLKPYLKPGRKVTIKVTGSTDASPIKGSIYYDNTYGTIKNKACFVNGVIDYLNVTKEEGIKTNEQLAFLRTFGVRDFIEKNIEALRVTDNQFQHFAVVSDEIGAEQRKVSMEIIIHEAFEDTHEELSSKNQKAITENISDVDTGIVVTNMKNPDAVAVVIGNRNYGNNGNRTAKDVKYALNDARTIKQYLIKTMGYDEDRILYYENATSGNFRKIFGSEKSPQGDLYKKVRKGISDVFIYYSGHGVPDVKKQEPYLLPVDVPGSNDIDIRNNAYSLNLMYKNVALLNPKTVTVVLDACYSGNKIDRSTSRAVGEVPMKQPEPDRLQNMAIFTAVQQNEEANWFHPNYHGMFTYFFLKGIKHNTTKKFNQDRELSYAELFNFLKDDNYGIPYYSRDYGDCEQHPDLKGGLRNNTFITY